MASSFVVGNVFREIQVDGFAQDLDLSNDGTLLAVAIHTGKPTVRVFRTDDGACVGEFGQGTWSAFGVAFVDGGRSLCYLTRDDLQNATLWQMALPARAPVKLLSLESELRCTLLARDPSGTRLAVGGTQVLVIDVAAAKEILRVPCPRGGVACLAGANRLWVAGCDGSDLVLHDVATGEPLKKLAGPTVTAMQVLSSPDGRWLVAVGGGGHGIALYDLTTGTRITSDADHDGFDLDDHFEAPGACAFSHDSTLVVYPHRFIGSMTLPGLTLTMADTMREDETGDHVVQAATALEAPLIAFAFHRSHKVVLVPTAATP